MIKKTKIIISNKLGLHARASAKFVATANKYQSIIHVIKDAQRINGKSIMGVMMLAATKGCELELHIEGPDAAAMEIALVELIENKFHELE
jgi:phosphocarrier protein HPr